MTHSLPKSLVEAHLYHNLDTYQSFVDPAKTVFRLTLRLVLPQVCARHLACDGAVALEALALLTAGQSR